MRPITGRVSGSQPIEANKEPGFVPSGWVGGWVVRGRCVVSIESLRYINGCGAGGVVSTLVLIGSIRILY